MPENNDNRIILYVPPKNKRIIEFSVILHDYYILKISGGAMKFYC